MFHFFRPDNYFWVKTSRNFLLFCPH